MSKKLDELKNKKILLNNEKQKLEDYLNSEERESRIEKLENENTIDRFTINELTSEFMSSLEEVIENLQDVKIEKKIQDEIKQKMKDVKTLQKEFTTGQFAVNELTSKIESLMEEMNYYIKNSKEFPEELKKQIKEQKEKIEKLGNKIENIEKEISGQDIIAEINNLDKQIDEIDKAIKANEVKSSTVGDIVKTKARKASRFAKDNLNTVTEALSENAQAITKKANENVQAITNKANENAQEAVKSVKGGISSVLNTMKKEITTKGKPAEKDINEKSVIELKKDLEQNQDVFSILNNEIEKTDLEINNLRSEQQKLSYNTEDKSFKDNMQSLQSKITELEENRLGLMNKIIEAESKSKELEKLIEAKGGTLYGRIQNLNEKVKSDLVNNLSNLKSAIQSNIVTPAKQLASDKKVVNLVNFFLDLGNKNLAERKKVTLNNYIDNPGAIENPMTYVIKSKDFDIEIIIPKPANIVELEEAIQTKINEFAHWNEGEKVGITNVNKQVMVDTLDRTLQELEKSTLKVDLSKDSKQITFAECNNLIVKQFKNAERLIGALERKVSSLAEKTDSSFLKNMTEKLDDLKQLSEYVTSGVVNIMNIAANNQVENFFQKALNPKDNFQALVNAKSENVEKSGNVTPPAVSTNNDDKGLGK